MRTVSVNRLGKDLKFSKDVSIIILSILCIVTFYPTLFNDFQYAWDDNWQLLDNPFISDHSIKSIIYHFTSFYHNQYSPVNTLYYILISKLFGFNPAAYHAGSLIIHCFSVLLVFHIIRKIIKKLKPNFSSNRITLYSFFTALIFAIHPLQVEAVAWISASKVILYGFFVLLACWNYIRYLESFNIFRLVLVMLFYLLAFGSKEQAIIFPLNMLLLDYIYGRYKELKLSWKVTYNKIFLEKLPFFIVALLLWYFSVQNNLGVVYSNTYPLHQRFLFGSHSLLMYIFRFLAPVKLFYYYFYPIEPGGVIPLAYWQYPFLTAIVFIFIYSNYKKGNKIVIVGFLFFLINLLLTLHILPLPRGFITADRFMYLSTIGIALIFICLFNYLMMRYKQCKKWITGCVAAFLIFFMVQSGIRTSEWKNSDAIKQNIKEILEQRKADNLPAKNPLENR